MVHVLKRASPKARLSAPQRSCVARATGESPPQWRCASASNAAALGGVAINSCTYCTISFGSTRTVKFGCVSLFMGPVWGCPPDFQGYGKLRGMNDDLLLLVVAAGALAGGYRIWQV